MNELFWSVRGYVTLELTGASPQWALNELTKRNVNFRKVRWIDPFTVRISLGKKNLPTVHICARRSMCDMTVVEEVGIHIVLRQILKRPILLIMTLISVLSVFLLPRYVCFYQVIGNETVPEAAVLRAMDKIGIGFGTKGVDIKPQWVKDRVLHALPDLEWLTVSQNGCRAQVVVRERKHLPQTENRKGYGHVIAARSGIITEQSVLAGQPLCKVGDTVAQGDILVSGMVDLERTYLLQRAQAEIYARTWHKTETVIPMDCLEKQYTGKEHTVLWLQLGDRRIKIFGNSGISVASCDKMIKRKNLVLPGGLKLPAAWIRETYLPYETVRSQRSEAELSDMLQENVRARTAKKMIAGQILQEGWKTKSDDGCLRLTGILECHEMIAVSVEAALEQGGDAYDGENRQRRENGADH